MIDSSLLSGKTTNRRKLPEDYFLTTVMEQLRHLKQEKDHIIVAMDGRCASGKTTLAIKIQQEISCNIVQMDDFFLPSELKTKERLEKVAGNIHDERIKREVLSPWKQDPKQTVKYRPYNCQTNTYDSPIILQAKKLNIVEGVYSMHPDLLNFYDYKIFLTVDEKTQRERLQKRDPKQLNLFLKQWVPMEEKYFKQTKIHDKSDLIIDTSDIF